jgi:hypothetical protein
MQIRPLMQPGAFGPEVIAAMGEALEAALKELQHTGPTDVVREIVAGRIIGAARLGERDPARLRAAARPDTRPAAAAGRDRWGQRRHVRSWRRANASDTSTAAGWSTGAPSK